jgi:DNA-binding MarR family transcriptional regulator
MASTFDPDSFGFLLTDVTRMIRAELDRRTADAGFGLTPGEGRTLSHAFRAGGVRQNVLAERMGVEAMTLSGSLDRLEARGLIERRPDLDDRRAKTVHLTPAGEAMLERIQPIAAALRADASSTIPAEQWHNFVDVLKTVRANLAAMRADPCRKDGAT